MPTEAVPIVHPENQTQLQPPYHVVLWNDDDHSYEYVIEMLGKIFGHDVPTAFRMAQEVDTVGRCNVFTGTLEQAEFKRDRIHAYGADPKIQRCKGSMSASIEPAEG
ncbi:MAG: ATP-dependent Clp protease adaptor ClpS [Planctomycetes bacterium]|nr:ATP-dependent Clp protease adaptor ClpS [Planctomycetota bacterium]